MKKFFRSLLAKYMLIILMALVLFQVAYVMIASFALIGQNVHEKQYQDDALSPDFIEENWNLEAMKLENPSKEQIAHHFAKWKQVYPEASMFWVNGNGQLIEQLNVKENLPTDWDSAYTAKFIKERYGGNPFTVIAFIGNNENQGFIVFELNRTTLNPPLMKVYEQYGTFLLLGVVIIVVSFILISFSFFRGIRKRLVYLQDAMSIRDVDGLPVQVAVKKQDEIGQLEQSFNQMVEELRASREREQKEEQLRRELIANLSHDLRTPLTKIRAQTYTLTKNEQSPKKVEQLKKLEASVASIDRLIENLMSYTLLMSKKYQYNPQELDILRFVRESLATWYPVFEKEGFEMNIELNHLREKSWTIDPIWFERILDNLFQNIIRHAKSGQYIGVYSETTEQFDAIVITDRGKGMKNESDEKGAGIGLSIVDLMIKNMQLNWEVETNQSGTTIKIIQKK
ncbi:sensor histidine kinase [Mesobacillus maritimus]|uniref:histidine kinase n=1 Tax=Mesobacillus maritimus TaxID=1643336 RepID=A0ABS7K8F9_9BACI|nr:HAMP domain-containing sensor histidine kinase [Mesobacillus maritimus]MBY0098548.1 HAMP domain-containing histidine kinase [Mesobacillus maritimus]